MLVYAAIIENVLEVLYEPTVGYTEYDVVNIRQLSLDTSINDDVTTEGDVEIQTTVGYVDYDEYTEGVLKQIKNVSTFMLKNAKYAEGTKAYDLLMLAIETATADVIHLKPPVTTELEEDEYIIEKVKLEKLKEMNDSKKVEQSIGVKSLIGDVECTFFAGTDNATKYASVLGMFKDAEFVEVYVEEGMFSINVTDLTKALDLLTTQGYNGWRKEYDKIIEVHTTVASEVVGETITEKVERVKAIKW